MLRLGVALGWRDENLSKFRIVCDDAAPKKKKDCFATDLTATPYLSPERLGSALRFASSFRLFLSFCCRKQLPMPVQLLQRDFLCGIVAYDVRCFDHFSPIPTSTRPEHSMTQNALLNATSVQSLRGKKPVVYLGEFF